MSLQENIKNIKSYYPFLDHVVVLCAICLSFLLGQMSYSMTNHEHIVFIEGEEIDQKEPDAVTVSGNKSIYASRSGTKYYYVWCNESRIKEGNKVWFGSSEEAKSKGYEKAKNCPGD